MKYGNKNLYQKTVKVWWKEHEIQTENTVFEINKNVKSYWEWY